VSNLPGEDQRAAEVFDLILDEKDVLTPEKLIIKQREAANAFDNLV
jgi:hypothetical protein